jgi:hypothetical protein
MKKFLSKYTFLVALIAIIVGCVVGCEIEEHNHYYDQPPPQGHNRVRHSRVRTDFHGPGYHYTRIEEFHRDGYFYHHAYYDDGYYDVWRRGSGDWVRLHIRLF